MCIFLAVFAVIIKVADSPVTNYIENKITGILSYNVDIKDFLYKMDNFIQKADEKNHEKMKMLKKMKSKLPYPVIIHMVVMPVIIMRL